MVDALGGRAMLEVQLACHTDRQLQEALKETLRDWDRASLWSDSTLKTGIAGDHDDAELLWRVWRCFMRGLLVHVLIFRFLEYLKRLVV